MSPLIQVEHKNYTLLRIARSATFNSLNFEMIVTIARVLRQVNSVVLFGGSDAFSVGDDYL